MKRPTRSRRRQRNNRPRGNVKAGRARRPRIGAPTSRSLTVGTGIARPRTLAPVCLSSRAQRGTPHPSQPSAKGGASDIAASPQWYYRFAIVILTLCVSDIAACGGRCVRGANAGDSSSARSRLLGMTADAHPRRVRRPTPLLVYENSMNLGVKTAGSV